MQELIEQFVRGREADFLTLPQFCARSAWCKALGACMTCADEYKSIAVVKSTL